ncbi:hypothetical protein ZIOFF_072500 [Zingiber officinale]|uniref:Protein FAR1-RELATED SEQUENCE n=1 Tax=Zingiber officinale TaxID=94328 RepID=A0A8J5C5Z7_ZINOF|nr:hypothetical protein ZIOFF_072500 [Zingiber officinale]
MQLGEEIIMEEGKFDSNEMKDKIDPSPSTVEKVKLPEIGMIFSSEEEVRTFYNSYATNAGFGISKLGGRNGDDGKQKYFSIGCAKNRKKVSQAKNVLHPRPSSKTNCKAKINVAVRNDGNFVITSVDLEHNHLLSPGKSRQFRFEVGGYENLSFDERKCRNNISEARRHVIKVLMRMKVIEFPMHYIMDRWRKDIKRGYQSISNIYDDYGCDGKRLQYNALTPLMQEVQQLGAENDDICSVLVKIMKDTKEKLIIAMENGQSMVEQLEEASTSGAKVIHSPLKVRTKGRPPIKRKQSKVEQIVKKSIAKTQKKSTQNYCSLLLLLLRTLRVTSLAEEEQLLLQRRGRRGCGALEEVRAGEGEEKTAGEGAVAASARGKKGQNLFEGVGAGEGTVAASARREKGLRRFRRS